MHVPPCTLILSLDLLIKTDSEVMMWLCAAHSAAHLEKEDTANLRVRGSIFTHVAQVGPLLMVLRGFISYTQKTLNNFNSWHKLGAMLLDGFFSSNAHREMH